MENRDLHTHSNFSDGVFPPEVLAERAKEKGLVLWALTDHDTMDGIDRARSAAQKNGVGFVAGVEVSSIFNGVSVHIVGLNVDDKNEILKNGVWGIRNTRFARAQKMAASLAQVGIDNALDGALQFCENRDAISRAHFARFLVKIGKAATTSEVFNHYMVPGKPGYVPHEWPEIPKVVAWIKSAGGVAVLAHPGRYDFSKNARSHLIRTFKESGGDAIEVASSAHSAEDIRFWASVAQKHGFAASVGSDFHTDDEVRRAIGKAPPLPPNLKPVWALW